MCSAITLMLNWWQNWLSVDNKSENTRVLQRLNKTNCRIGRRWRRRQNGIVTGSEARSCKTFARSLWGEGSSLLRTTWCWSACRPTGQRQGVRHVTKQRDFAASWSGASGAEGTDRHTNRTSRASGLDCALFPRRTPKTLGSLALRFSVPSENFGIVPRSTYEFPSTVFPSNNNSDIWRRAIIKPNNICAPCFCFVRPTQTWIRINWIDFLVQVRLRFGPHSVSVKSNCKTLWPNSSSWALFDNGHSCYAVHWNILLHTAA